MPKLAILIKGSNAILRGNLFIYFVEICYIGSIQGVSVGFARGVNSTCEQPTVYPNILKYAPMCRERNAKEISKMC